MEMGGLGIMGGLVVFTIGIVVLIAVTMFVPTIAGTIEDAQPALASDSDWNATHNTNLPNIASKYESISPLIWLAAIVAVIALVLGVLIGLGRV